MKALGMAICIILAIVLAALSTQASSAMYVWYLVGASLLGVLVGLIKNWDRWR